VPLPILFRTSDLEFLLLIALNKPLYGTVVGPLHILREIASWQLARLQMVSDAFAANAFSATGFVGAVAIRFVLLDFTFSHIRSTFDMLMLLVRVGMMMGEKTQS
jgi:hypothetical protein